MAITPWTDEPATSKTPKLALHITELRTAVEAARAAYSPPSGGWTPWTNVPLTTSTPALATHVSEMRTAIQQLWAEKILGTIPAWTERGGAGPTAGTPAYATDISDIRYWFNLFESDGIAPPRVFWGVDSLELTNFLVPNGSGGYMDFYDWVKQKAGDVPPAFWGRYFGGPGNLTASEIQYIHGKGCKVALIYNATDLADHMEGGVLEGIQDALAAIALADNLHPPKTVALFANIEAAFHPTAAWMRGWATAMNRDQRFAGSGGFYGHTGNTNFTVPYCAAVAAIPDIMRYNYLWGAGFQGTDTCGFAADHPDWDPYLPGCNDMNIGVWQFAIHCYKAISPSIAEADEDLATDVGLSLMW